MSPSLATRVIDSLGPWLDAPKWWVGLSGGMDSMVLLHLLAGLARQQALPPIAALHVHHGLQPAADDWAEQCRSVCEGLGIEFVLRRVSVERRASLEGAARDARYRAFADSVGPGELLLCAHHRDDQVETLLFRLLRGAGVLGLAGMRRVRGLGEGLLVRPLLEVGRDEIEAYALANGLAWVDDPSNADQRLARNFLRHRILPELEAGWPQARASIARAADNLSEAQELLDELAETDLAAAAVPGAFGWLPVPSLELSVVASLSPARQRNLLRHWLGGRTALPDSRHWVGWEALRDAAPDALPRWQLGSGSLIRSEGRIWYLAGAWDCFEDQAGRVPVCAGTFELPGNGQLELLGEGDIAGLEIRYRQGGESLNLPGRGRRDLKRLLNESGIPAFVRPRLPLLFCGDELVAVANVPSLSSGPITLRWQPPGLS